MKKKFLVRGIPAYLLFIIYGCVYHSLPDPAACEENPMSIVVSASQDSDCGASNGSFEVVASGGNGSYRYQLDNGELQSDPSFAGVAAGNYAVTVYDERNCIASVPVSIKNKDGVNLESTFTDAGCKTSAGSITLTAVGGIEPYAFKVSGGEFQSGATFENLASGEYLVTVRDATGCESNESVIVSSGISFSQTIAPIIETKCAISGCHNGSQFPDFRSIQTIRSNAANIKRVTGNGSMPATGSLTQTQIDQIACWVDDGALDN